MNLEPTQALARYCHFYETLTPERLSELDRLTTRDVEFRDPFNHVVGTQAMKRVFERMFARLATPRFEIIGTALNDDTAFISWRFHFSMRFRQKWIIEGVSEVHFSEQGLVAVHIDHWDASDQLYRKLPVVGPFFSLLRRIMA